MHVPTWLVVVGVVVVIAALLLIKYKFFGCPFMDEDDKGKGDGPDNLRPVKCPYCDFVAPLPAPWRTLRQHVLGEHPDKYDNWLESHRR